MAHKIFVNMPVKDLEKSKEFFGRLGFKFNAQFTDEKAACLVISDDIYSMLLTEPFFKSFIKKEIADTQKTTEAILALSAESREEVDELMRKVLAAGGTEFKEVQDLGWMYGRGFQDIDGHLWETFWMDPSRVNPV